MGCGCCPLRNRSDFINASIKYVWSSFPVEYLVSFFIEQIHPNLDFCMVLTKWYNPHSCTRINFINVPILINFKQNLGKRYNDNTLLHWNVEYSFENQITMNIE